MANYKSDNLKSQLAKEQIIDLALAVQDIQRALDSISVPKLAKNLAGMTKQGLHAHIAKRKNK